MALITSANAREMSIKAVAARQAARLIEKNRLALIDELLAKAAVAAASTDRLAEQEAYLQRRLERVRAQLNLLDTRIEQEAKKKDCDGQLLNWLCAAQERLAEQERTMAGRPLPGSRRPPREDASSSKVAPQPRPAFTHAGPAPNTSSQTSPPTSEGPGLTERPDF